ncbi:MAG TPA: prohibitin family protein [Flavobacteriales bacterium]|nr:prohibitin family protein [Flavobacteriales bacterium]
MRTKEMQNHEQRTTSRSGRVPHRINGLMLVFLSILAASCTTVRQGTVGVKQRFGKLDDRIITAGLVGVNPFSTRVIKVPIRTVNREVELALPSKEGLNVQCEISILYRIMPEKVPQIIGTIGPDYEQAVIVSVFRSAAADICARYYAKDMHSAQRSVIEAEIATYMNSVLSERGMVIENVLMKSIKLPAGLAKAIEDKLEAEQRAQQMEFILQRERSEAQRRVIEAEGIRDAQLVLTEGLNENIIRYQSIEAFKQLSASPNAKVIITNGETPFLIQNEQP